MVGQNQIAVVGQNQIAVVQVGQNQIAVVGQNQIHSLKSLIATEIEIDKI